MKFNKKEAATKAELAMMGRVCTIASLDELEFILDTMLAALGYAAKGSEVLEKIKVHASEKNEYKHISCAMLEGMHLINVVAYNPDEDGDTYELTRENGVFGYCYNASSPDCSEWGYSGFKKGLDRVIRREW